MLTERQKDDLIVVKTRMESVLNDLVSLHNNLGYDVENQIRTLNFGLNALYDVIGITQHYHVGKNDYGDMVREKI
jgi:hypothetical protein